MILSINNNVVGKINLLNVMLSTLHPKDSVIIVHEDFASLPIAKKGVDIIAIDSLDDQNEKKYSKVIAPLIQGYDNAFVLLDNYKIGTEEKLQRIKEYEGYKGSLITTWPCIIRSEFETMTLFEIAEELNMDSIIPNVFDAFILLDEVNVEDAFKNREIKERIRIINK